MVETLEKRELLSAVAWGAGPALPAPRSDAVALLAPDKTVIVLGGETTGDPRNVPKLANTASAWTSGFDLELVRIGHGAVRTPGSGVFVYGGVDGNEASDEVLNYDFYFGDSRGAPTIRYYQNGLINGDVRATANFPLEIRLTAAANPAPTYSLVSGPTTLTVDATTGRVQWTPTAVDVGPTTAVVAATNSVGSTQLTIPITVAADLPVPSFQFNPTGGAQHYALPGVPFEIQVNDASNTPSTFELLSNPPGMVIDPDTGLIQWTPTVADAGQQTVTVRATNSAGSTERSTSFIAYFTGSVSNIVATDLEQLHPTLTWTAPTGLGSEEVAGYTIELTLRYRVGRSYRTDRINFDSAGSGSSLELTGLKIGRTYKVFVNAYNAAGNVGLFSSEAATVRSLPALPVVSRTVQNPNGGPIVANQPVEIQLTDSNPDPSTIELIDAPTGLTLNAATGLASWIPSAAQVGQQTATFRFTNSIGSFRFNSQEIMKSWSSTILCLLLFCVSPAHAEVAFSTFGPNKAFDAFNGSIIEGPGSEFPQTIAELFSPGTSLFLDSVELAVSSSLGMPELSLGIYSDSGGVPNTELDYDDSFIAYVNGVEVARSSFGTAGVPEPFDGLGADHESTNGDSGQLLERYFVDLATDFPSLLQAGGGNVLAIHGLNSSLDNSDFVLSQISLGGNELPETMTIDYLAVCYPLWFSPGAWRCSRG